MQLNGIVRTNGNGKVARVNGMTASTEPLYNIGVVARMTGIPVATIRVWERRYGFPRSARTDGGHRIYSEQEVSRLRWVKARVDDGLPPSKAVHALEFSEEQGRFPEPPGIDVARSANSVSDGTLTRFHERLTNVLLAHDMEGANRILGDVLALYSVEELILGVLRPTLVDIGEGWIEGTVSIATEHLASQFVRERLLMWMPSGPPAYPVRPTVMACAPDEWHDLSMLMLGVLLRRRRWPVSYLGQSVPLPDLAEFVKETQPPAVALVAMRESSAEAISHWPQYLPEAAETGRPPVCFGGMIFSTQPEWQDKVPGSFLGNTLTEGLDTMEAVLREVTGLASS